MNQSNEKDGTAGDEWHEAVSEEAESTGKGRDKAAVQGGSDQNQDMSKSEKDSAEEHLNTTGILTAKDEIWTGQKASSSTIATTDATDTTGLLAAKQTWKERACATTATASATATDTTTTTGTDASISSKNTIIHCENSSPIDSVPGAFRIGSVDHHTSMEHLDNELSMLESGDQQQQQQSKHDLFVLAEAHLVQEDRQLSQLGRDLQQMKEENERLRRREEEERNKITAVGIPIEELDQDVDNIPRKKHSVKAIASLICAIAGLLTLFLGIVLCPVAICLAVRALKEIKENPDQVGGRCMSISGLVIGIIGFASSFILVFLFILGTVLPEQ
jgi:Domain of unknown function (DUF4190)